MSRQPVDVPPAPLFPPLPDAPHPPSKMARGKQPARTGEHSKSLRRLSSLCFGKRILASILGARDCAIPRFSGLETQWLEGPGVGDPRSASGGTGRSVGPAAWAAEPTWPRPPAPPAPALQPVLSADSLRAGPAAGLWGRSGPSPLPPHRGPRTCPAGPPACGRAVLCETMGAHGHSSIPFLLRAPGPPIPIRGGGVGGV